MVTGQLTIGEQLHALAAVLTAIRGRLEVLSVGLPEEEPEGETEISRPSLRSLISCVLTDSLDIAIRDLLRAAEQEPATMPQLVDQLAADGETYESVMERVENTLPDLLAEQQSRSREADDLFVDLMASEGVDRVVAVADERYHRALLVGKLLEEAGSALPEDPARAEELAGLAAVVAAHLVDVVESMEWRARAICRLAQARRSAGDPAGAERLLAEAALYPGDPDVQADLCRALALLRWEQGRNEEAAALLDRAAALWAEEERPHEEGACRVLRALLLVEEGKAADVVGLLRGELPLLAEPWLARHGGLALALGLAERGLSAKARAMRDENAALLNVASQRTHVYALRLEGEIAARLGELATAEALFEELRLGALERRSLPEATAATLALMCLDVARGEAGEPARERAAALAATFSGTQGLDGVMAVLGQLPQQLATGESPWDLAATLTANVLRLLRLRGVQSAPLPFT
jgi:hypothetical protein